MDARVKTAAIAVLHVVYAAIGAKGLQAALQFQVKPRVYGTGGLPGHLLPFIVNVLPFALPALLGAIWIAYRRPAWWRIAVTSLGVVFYLPYAITLRVVGGSAWKERLIVAAAVLAGCWAGGRLGVYLNGRRRPYRLRRWSRVLLGLAPLAAVAVGVTSVYLFCPARWSPAAREELARLEIPVFPGAQGVERRGGAFMVNYTVESRYPSLEVLRFYQERLRAMGWTAYGEADEEWGEIGVHLTDELKYVRVLNARWASPSGYLVLQLTMAYESPDPDWPSETLRTQRVSVRSEFKHLWMSP